MILLAICDMYLINRIENIYPRLYWLDTGGPDGPLPPMVQLVPIEKDVDPLIVFVKGTWYNSTCCSDGHRGISSARWYQ